MEITEAPVVSSIEITTVQSTESDKKKISETEIEKMDVQPIEKEQEAEKEKESESAPIEPLTKSFTTSEEDDEEAFESKNGSLNDGNTYIAWKPDVPQQPVSFFFLNLRFLFKILYLKIF